MARAQLSVAGSALVFAGVVALLVMQPAADGRAAVMAWPGSAEGAAAVIAARAGGAIVAGGRRGIVIAQSGRPGFVLRLYAAGAFFVFNPLLAGGCNPLSI